MDVHEKKWLSHDFPWSSHLPYCLEVHRAPTSCYGAKSVFHQLKTVGNTEISHDSEGFNVLISHKIPIKSLIQIVPPIGKYPHCFKSSIRLLVQDFATKKCVRSVWDDRTAIAGIAAGWELAYNILQLISDWQWTRRTSCSPRCFLKLLETRYMSKLKLVPHYIKIVKQQRIIPWWLPSGKLT